MGLGPSARFASRPLLNREGRTARIVHIRKVRKGFRYLLRNLANDLKPSEEDIAPFRVADVRWLGLISKWTTSCVACAGICSICGKMITDIKNQKQSMA
jgi:hypothetical protein